MKIKIKSIFGHVLFEHECEGNTIKKTVEEAVKNNANLYNANLENAYLKHANLENAYLYNANLENANLKHANLYNANLENANLYNANLENAYLKHANLYNANLENANLYNAYLYNAKLSITCKWSFGFVDDKIFIGCKLMNINEWDSFFNSDEEFSTKRGTKDFIEIQATYEALKAYKLFKEKHCKS